MVKAFSEISHLIDVKGATGKTVRIQVSAVHYEHRDTWGLNGAPFGTLEYGKGSVWRETKQAIKKVAEMEKLNIGKITHSIYGIYSADILGRIAK